MKKSKNCLMLIVLSVLSQFLVACEFQPVGAGVWDIRMDSPRGELASVWTITADEKISMEGGSIARADEVELSGSRIGWSTETSELMDASGQPLGVNFGGTVNGNSLAGTVYSTLGNFTVTGTRR